MLASALVVEEGLTHKWLNAPPLVWIGVISYSIYVWQELFLRRLLGRANRSVSPMAPEAQI
jgi:peptidoglycan/LPS O-acetylase OafA/YrhL